MSVTTLTQKTKNILHGIFPILGAIRYGVVGQKIRVIGITGTDGKSSSVLLTAAMLRAGGYKVAHFSSISFHDGVTEQINQSKMTTPGHMDLQKFLSEAIENGCTFAVLEITSQGILQHRHRRIGFSLVGITNITPEHIEAHGGFENYRNTKLSLINSLKKENLGLVIDKQTYDEMSQFISNEITITTIGIDRQDIDLHCHVVRESIDGISLEMKYQNKIVCIKTKLAGPFIAHNISFASRIATVCGVSLDAIRKAIELFEVIPGRFEIINKLPLVIVDYAHTINALEILLPYVRKHTKGKLVHVFGAAGGGRDSYKRPLIAKLSERNANVSILTEENSFDEPTELIIQDIVHGFSPKHQIHLFYKREQAVELGLSLLNSPDDTLLLTAKGSETVIMGPDRTKRPYNERAYIKCQIETSSFA
jgi:UDP-N-acetylmuramoyl-L-alanyl-D-glutamate--2,6-diaminopimelate ligase